MLALASACLLPLGCSKAEDKQGASSEAPAPVAKKVEPWCKACKCKEGAVDPSKGQQSCELTEDMEVQGYPVKAGKIQFNKEGHMTRFALTKETKIGDVECKAKGSVELVKPGVLRSCYTNKTVAVSGVQCTGPVALHRGTTKLSRCQLAAAKKFGDLDIPKGSWVSLYESGKLERFEVKVPIEVQGQKCKGYMNFLHESGKLAKCNLAEDAKIEGKDYEKGKSVCFGEDEKVTECNLLKFRMTG